MTRTSTCDVGIVQPQVSAGCCHESCGASPGVSHFVGNDQAQIFMDILFRFFATGIVFCDNASDPISNCVADSIP